MIKQFINDVPFDVKVLICCCLTLCAVSLSYYVWVTYSISHIIGFAAYGFLITSMTQHDIVKLRVWGACAGTCFMVQFAMSDLPAINMIGQGALVIYGIIQAYKESKIKEKKA
jgi:apolipoprotein N-acyltransferase